MKYRRNVQEAFAKNIVQIPIAGCWIWMGKLNNGGYGRITDENGKVMLAHRWSFKNFVSKIMPPVVMHDCDNPSCVNPSHLKGGTQKINLQDMWRKNRGKTPRLTRDKCHLTRYSINQINEVKKLRATGMTQMQIKQVTNISQSHISRILNGDTK